MDLSCGEFVIYEGQLYRSVSYNKEFELFEVADKECKRPLFKVEKENIDDAYMEFARCDYNGVRYVACAIEDDSCTFKNILGGDKIFCRPLSEMNEVWRVRNYKKAGVQKEILFLNERCIDCNPSDNYFYVEEMACGNLMTAHLEEDKDIDETIRDLEQLYGERIVVGTPDFSMLLVDCYENDIIIDNEKFGFSEDWGIVTINSESENGNRYIREIVDYFNRK